MKILQTFLVVVVWLSGIYFFLHRSAGHLGLDFAAGLFEVGFALIMAHRVFGYLSDD